MSSTRHNPLLLRCLMAVAWLCVLGGMGMARATPPAAGTTIQNIATATYVDAASGLSVHLQSNPVNVIVLPLESCTLSAGQTITRVPGAAFALPHTLGNNGNTTETCLLEATIATGSDYTPVGLKLVQDLNGNGIVDPGEPAIAAGSGISLAAGASVNLLVAGTVPATATPGQSASLDLIATSQVQHQRAAASDTVRVASGPALSVTKSASTANPLPGAALTYTITVTNQGNAPATGTPVLVDGNTRNLVLLRDAVPANTTFQNLALAGAATRLFHRLGDPSTSYLSTAPAQVDAIAWGVPTLATGASLSGQFGVVVNANAAGTLVNTAYADYLDGALVSVPSNVVQLPLPSNPAQIDFYPDGGYATPTQQSPLGAPLFVQINAAACNVDSTRVLTYPVQLASQLSRDLETYTAVETAANSGVFRIQPKVPAADARMHAVVTGDGTMQLLPNDVVSATLLGCSAAGKVSATLLIDPEGVVFDSKSNQPVAGATVTLIDVGGAGNGGHAGGPAKVFQADGVTPAPNSVVTLADGAFSFPVVLPGSYRYQVVPPQGEQFPSKLPPALQPAGRTIDPAASYGNSFAIASKGPVRFDVPLDPGASGGLVVQKTASRSSAEIGDFVDYTITVSNHSGIALYDIRLSDWLPAGFVYVNGSARMQGATLADPRHAGGAMGFAIGTLQNQAEQSLTYRVVLAPNAQSGNGINTAQAQSGTLRSNLAAAKVTVIGGVFTDKAVLIGKVFADCDGDRVQGTNEPGVPGVRVWLADGTYAVTDGDGKYSLYGLTPRTTVAAIDPATLPAGSRLEVLDHRNAFDPSSQFVDLKNGELHKTDFALGQCTPAIRADIAARRKAQSQPDEILQQGTQHLLSTTAATSYNTDARALPASGTLGPNGAVNGLAGNSGNGGFGAGSSLFGAAADTGGPVAQQSPAAHPLFPSVPPSASTIAPLASSTLAKPVTPPSLSEQLPQLDARAGFIGLSDRQIMPTDQMRVQVKGPSGAKLALSVNGVSVPLSQVGTRASLASHGVTAWEYVGVNLQPGSNKLELSATDPFGNVRGHAVVNVRAPGPLAALRIVLPPKALADAQTPATITVQPVDAAGLPVTTRLPITLESSEGIWQVKDLNPSEPGSQAFVEGGGGQFALLPPAHPGTALITVSSGSIQAEAKLTFSPDLRPLFGVGLVEGVLNLSRLNPKSIVPAQSTDGFEREIQSVSRSFDDGKVSAAARSQVFLKGKVLGSTLLTLGYDSDKPSDTQLFRDIQPDSYYPIYGDSSVKGFDAQSTGKLYVRLDHGTSYVLLGDYTTQSDNPARQLTQYTRALNGLSGRLQEGRGTVSGFASHTASSQVVIELPGNGTSGPYQLNVNGVLNSQQVDLITRDRNQPGVVVSDKPLTPFVDYSIEQYTGRLLFNAPVPTIDANLNPVFVRVTYEVDNGGPKHWVGGVDAQYQINDWLSVGATAIQDQDPTNRQNLDGVNMTATLGAKSVLVGEVASSDTDQQGRGMAERLEWRGQGEKLQGRVWAIRTDTAFYNPSALQSAGQSQYGAQLGWLLDPKNRIAVEALHTASPLTGGSQSGETVSLQHSLPANMKLSVGLRHAAGDAQTTPTTASANLPVSTPVEFTSAFVRLDAPVPGLPQASMFTQYEHALDQSAQVASVGGNYALGNAGKLYFHHESNDSLSGPYGLSPNVNQYSTVFGFEGAVVEHTQLFNEYRIGQGIDGRSAEDAIGLRRLWQVAPGLGISASAERIHPVAGQVSDESSALTGAVSYTAADDWKGSARLEWRNSQQSRSWLATAALAAKLDANWTMLNRGIYSLIDDSGTATGSQHLAQYQTGFAYRPTDSDVWNAIGLVGYKRNQDSTLPAGQQIDERSWIVSTQLNVQPDENWQISGRYAAKHAQDHSNGVSSTGWIQLIGGRVTHDIAARWDAGVQAYASWGVGTRQRAYGLELGYLVQRNLWVSLGYNFEGFRDPDLSGGAYTQDGVYLRLRFKFGANLFEQAGEAQALPAGPANAAAAMWSPSGSRGVGDAQ